MKTFLRIFHYARPVEKYAIPYFFCVILHAIFNTLTFSLIIPVLTTLFDGDAMKVAVTEMPQLELSTSCFENVLKFFIFKQFGLDYSIQDVLFFMSILVVLVVLLSNIFRFASQKIMENFRIHTLQNLRDSLFKNIMRLNVRFFSNERKGDILSKLTSDINVVQFCVTNTLQVAFKEPALIIGYFIALLTISGKLTLFVLMMLPFTALIIGFIVKKLRRQAKEAQESLGEMISVAEEALTGVKVIKSYNAVDYIIGKFISIDNRYSTIMRNMATRQQIASPMSEFLGVSAVAVILIYGGGMVVGGELDASAFLAYIAMFSQVTRPARSIADSFSTIHQGIAAGDRVIELIDMKPTITDDNSDLFLEEFKEKIEFKNVSFKYDDSEKIILDNVSFTVNKGETVAIVGSSGGGKSTIANLLPRFYDTLEGEILIDGKNIKDYKISSLRNVMSYVSQEVTLFNDTIKNNITLGNKSASEEEIVYAAKVANADKFIRETIDGYNTNIGDSGVKLSGGQRQRLSIARAILRNPQILILDEATSALDTESEKLVQEALDKLLQNRTSLVIAHRLSTIQHADKIVVVDAGKVIEQGTHKELLEVDGVYKKLIDMQQL
ncbi:MAG: ABC transporter transmembrane domain-containing protein [Rikenellaceae bacterium]